MDTVTKATHRIHTFTDQHTRIGKEI